MPLRSFANTIGLQFVKLLYVHKNKKRTNNPPVGMAQIDLWGNVDETPIRRMRRKRDAIEFYQHGVNWTNRLIAGDSLVIMNSQMVCQDMN